MVEESKWEPDAAWQDTSEPPSSVDEPELPSSEPEPSSQDERALDARDRDFTEIFASLWPTLAPTPAKPARQKSLLGRAKAAASWAWFGPDDGALEDRLGAEDVASYWAADDASKLQHVEREHDARVALAAARRDCAGDFDTDQLTRAELADLGRVMLRAKDGDAAKRDWFRARAAKRRPAGNVAAKLEAARREMRSDTRELVMGQAARRDLEASRRETDRQVKEAQERAEASRRRLEAMRARRDRPLTTTFADDAAEQRPRARPKPPKPPARQPRKPRRPKSPERIRPKARSAGELEDLAALDVYWKAPTDFRDDDD